MIGVTATDTTDEASDTIFGVDREIFTPALAGDLAGEGQSGTQLSVLTIAFGLGSIGGIRLSGGG